MRGLLELLGFQVQVQVSEKKSLDKYELFVRSAVEGVGIRDIQGGTDL